MNLASVILPMPGIGRIRYIAQGSKHIVDHSYSINNQATSLYTVLVSASSIEHLSLGQDNQRETLQ